MFEAARLGIHRCDRPPPRTGSWTSPLMQRGEPHRGWRFLWRAAALGTAAGVVSALAVGFASPELYTEWGSLAGSLIVIPLLAVVAGAIVVVPLAMLRRISWIALPIAMLAALISGTLVFRLTLHTGFARWSAARHWSAVERRAAADREAAERDVCRRLLAEPPIPPPPAPPGAEVVGNAPGARTGTGSLLGAFSIERCGELLSR
jgi:hypothetical protein